MAFINTEEGGKYLMLKTLITLYITGFTFYLILNWNKRNIYHLRALIYGVGIFGVIIAGLISENFHMFMLLSKIIIVLTTFGILGTRLNTETDRAPEELYINSFVTLGILAIAIGWWFYKTNDNKWQQNVFKTKTK